MYANLVGYTEWGNFVVAAQASTTLRLTRMMGAYPIHDWSHELANTELQVSLIFT